MRLLDDSSLMKMAALEMPVPPFKPRRMDFKREGRGFENCSSALTWYNDIKPWLRSALGEVLSCGWVDALDAAKAVFFLEDNFGFLLFHDRVGCREEELRHYMQSPKRTSQKTSDLLENIFRLKPLLFALFLKKHLKLS